MNKVFYAEFSKAEEQDDGTIKVFGYASSASEDSDGEFVTPEAIEAALPDYMKFGAVREMHQPKAAGTAIEAKVMEDGRTWFGAHVVDQEAIKKVQSKVYKGFSIGGKVLKRDPDNNNVITGIRLVEVSLVDRPANPDAVFTMFKADDMSTPAHDTQELTAIEELQALVNKGDITPTKLVELAKAAITGTSAVEEEVQKSFWDVAELANILACLKSVQRSAAFEQVYEGDQSEIPNRLKQNVLDLTQTLVAMIGEEVAEMAGDAAKDAVAKDDDDMSEADKAEDPNDGHTTDPKTTDKAASVDDSLSKAVGELGDNLKKVLEINEELMKVNSDLTKRIANLEAQPAPSKAVLKAVGKADDSLVAKGDQADEDNPPAGASPLEQATYEIKKLHRSGGQFK